MALAKIEAIVGTFPVTLQLLTREKDQARGFQHSSKPRPDEGLLFVYQNVGSKTFHMNNVPFDLHMICVGSDHNIVDIIHMKANSKELYTTPSNCKNVIELSASWDGAEFVSKGDKVDILGGI